MYLKNSPRPMTIRLRDLMEKVDNIQQQINTLSREMEIPRKNQKKMLRSLILYKINQL